MMIAPVRVFRLLPPRTPLPIVRPSRVLLTLNKTRLPRGRLGLLHSVSGESSEASSTKGQMSSELVASMKSKIQDALSAESVEVVDVEGDGQHVTINVISSSFEGKSSVDRQRMVYKAIWFEMQNVVHAVDNMITRTPSEAASK